MSFLRRPHLLAALFVIGSVITLSSSFAQSAPTTLWGRAYSAGDIRRLEVNGLRLGMSRDDVVRVLQARGFYVRLPEQPEWDAYYSSSNGTIWGTFGFRDARGPTPRLDRFSYYRNLTDREGADVEARRSDLIALVGQPTSLTQWVDGGQIADRFVLAADHRMVEDIDSDAASRCYVNWKCYPELDCRSVVRRVNGAVAAGGFGAQVLHLTATDYSARSRALLANRQFRERDFSDASCAIMPVH